LIELGIDEITLVLQIPPQQKANINIFDWENIANNLIYIFEQKANIIEVFGDRSITPKTILGYTNLYSYGEHNFQFTIAYHPYELNMGIAIIFSAQSLDYYCERTGLEVFEFLQKIRNDTIYTLRLSRVDIVADYIDENLDITALYHNLTHNTVGVFREQKHPKKNTIILKRALLKYSSYMNEGKNETIYIGSPKSNMLLRIYDKKAEQIAKNGSKLKKALQTLSWTRMECVLRHKYAHQMTEQLLLINTKNEYANLIACTFAPKFTFHKMDELGQSMGVIEYSQSLMDMITQKKFYLTAPESRNNELEKNIKYIFHGSGVIPTLHKIREIWNDDALTQLLTTIKEIVEEWEPNDDCRYWLAKNKSDYQIMYQDFEQYLTENITSQLNY